MKDKVKEAAIMADIGKIPRKQIIAKHGIGKATLDNLIYGMGDEYVQCQESAAHVLTPDDVRLIVQLNAAYPEISSREIAEKFEVKPARITDVLSGRAWSSITGIKGGKNG